MSAAEKRGDEMTERMSETMRDVPAYWLVEYERAMRAGDLIGADSARRELVRLGWRVTPIVGPRPPAEVSP